MVEDRSDDNSKACKVKYFAEKGMKALDVSATWSNYIVKVKEKNGAIGFYGVAYDVKEPNHFGKE